MGEIWVEWQRTQYFGTSEPLLRVYQKGTEGSLWCLGHRLPSTIIKESSPVGGAIRQDGAMRLCDVALRERCSMLSNKYKKINSFGIAIQKLLIFRCLSENLEPWPLRATIYGLMEPPSR